MKTNWRSFVGLCFVWALAVAPLGVLATAKTSPERAPLLRGFSLDSATLSQVGVLYGQFAFVCFVLFSLVGGMALWLRAMIDRVPPPYPNETNRHSDGNG